MDKEILMNKRRIELREFSIEDLLFRDALSIGSDLSAQYYVEHKNSSSRNGLCRLNKNKSLSGLLFLLGKRPCFTGVFL